MFVCGKGGWKRFGFGIVGIVWESGNRMYCEFFNEWDDIVDWKCWYIFVFWILVNGIKIEIFVIVGNWEILYCYMWNIIWNGIWVFLYCLGYWWEFMWVVFRNFYYFWRNWRKKKYVGENFCFGELCEGYWIDFWLIWCFLILIYVYFLCIWFERYFVFVFWNINLIW